MSKETSEQPELKPSLPTSMTSSTTPTVEPLDSASFVDVEQNLDVERVISAESAARPPSERARPVPPVYHNLSIHVLAILIPSSILGTLARLGLSALATYDGNSIFPLAYAQALGSFIIGVAISQREMIGRLCVCQRLVVHLAHADEQP